MKVLCLIDSLGSGGAQRQIVTLAKLLKEKRYDVSVLCYVFEDFFVDILKEVDISIYWVLESSYIKRALKIRRFIRKGKYDVVISFLDVPNFLNCFSAIGGRTWKVITSERSAKKKVMSSARGRLFGWFQRFADTIVCNSNNAKKMWGEYYPHYKGKLRVIYNLVLLPAIKSEYIPKRNGKLHIVVAASYQYLKNPIGLIKALSLLDENERDRMRVDWYGTIEVTKGDRSAYNEAVFLIKDNNLHRVIQLHEPTNDLANRINEADVIALFSKMEGLPNVICEGMMLGKPVIMSKVSDYYNLIDDNNGILCEWNDVKSIKAALLNMLSLNTEELLSMGNHSLVKAKMLFSPQTIINEWCELFDK